LPLPRALTLLLVFVFLTLKGDLIGQLVQISGIIISTSRTSAKATDLRIICKSCKHQKSTLRSPLLRVENKVTNRLMCGGTPSAVKCKPGFSSVMLPRSCENGSALDGDGVKVDCPPSPYVVLGDYCKFVDQQSLKLQENPETVPTGEMPRHVLLFSEKYAPISPPLMMLMITIIVSLVV
jgi:DNA replication licensing factor MCM5